MKTIVENPNLYDLLYADLSEDVEMYRKILKDSKSILEFGAGTGRVTIPLALDNHFVEAVDLSKDMLKILKQNIATSENLSKNVNLVLANMCNYNSKKKFDAIIVSLTSFNYLLTQKEQIECLTSIKNNLKDNGFAIVELLSENTFLDTNENDDYKFIKRLPINETDYYDYYRITKLDLKNRRISQYRKFNYYIENNFISQEIFAWNNRFVTIDDFKILTDIVGLSIEKIYGNCQLDEYSNESEDVFVKLRRS